MTSRTSLRRAGDQPLNDISDLLELAHQMRLGVQPASGIDDQNVNMTGERPLASIVRHTRRVSAWRTFDNLAARASRPYRKLIGRRGTKRVTSRQKDRLAPGL